MDIQTLLADLLRAVREGKGHENESIYLQIAISMRTVELHEQSIAISRADSEYMRLMVERQTVALERIAAALEKAD